MTKKIAINGRYLARRQTGQERFASETILELDKIAQPGEYELVVPLEYTKPIELKNIKVVRHGKAKSHLWEQTDFAYYVRKHRMLSLNLCTIQPLLAPGVVCIHDISYKINPQYWKTMYGRLSAIWHKLHYRVAMKMSPAILTVTQCSKQEIINQYHIKPNRVSVVPNGWEHIMRTETDDGVFNRFSTLQRMQYFIAISSLAPNKNFSWIFENAKCNPNKQYVIVGRASLSEYGEDYSAANLPNVLLTGYLADGELKALLQNCRALLFPSLYEGFGIPPMEALALGREAIVAKASCMPEIYQEYVHYLDPLNPNVDLDDLMKIPVPSPEKLLAQYRYANTARIIHDLLTRL